jgi:hypothetical protein
MMCAGKAPDLATLAPTSETSPVEVDEGRPLAGPGSAPVDVEEVALAVLAVTEVRYPLDIPTSEHPRDEEDSKPRQMTAELAAELGIGLSAPTRAEALIESLVDCLPRSECASGDESQAQRSQKGETEGGQAGSVKAGADDRRNGRCGDDDEEKKRELVHGHARDPVDDGEPSWPADRCHRHEGAPREEERPE